MANARYYQGWELCAAFPILFGAPCALANLFTSVQHWLEMLFHISEWIKTFREGRDAVQDNLRTGRPHVEKNKLQLLATPVGFWSPMDCAWVRSGTRSMSQNFAPHSARYSGLPQTCSSWDTQLTLRRATMAPLCSSTGLGRSVSKGKWWLSWTNGPHGRNLDSLIWTILDTPIKWMEASRVILYHAVSPRQTVNAPYYCMFLQHQPRSAFRRMRRHLVVQNSIILRYNARSHTAAAVTDLLCRGQWEILEQLP